MALEIKTADELVDRELEARWAARHAERQEEVFQYILRAFIEREGAIPFGEILAAFRDRPPDGVLSTLALLDEKDLIQVREARVELAYPFSAVPTAFTVALAGGRERYACCAIDALGIPAMLGQRVSIRSRCHHCGEALDFAAGVDGPERHADEIMVWVAKRGESERRISASL